MNCRDERQEIAEKLAASCSAGPPSFPVLEASCAELVGAMAGGRLSCRALVKSYLKRIALFDSTVNSMICLNPRILEEAERAEEELRAGTAGALCGLPVIVKDNINTKDLPTTMGSLALRGSRPKSDAFIVERLRRAGALILGKSSLSEFACTGMTNNSLIGQTLNPYDLTRTPGGSSGGTGAALAMNFAAAGLGTDGVNSVRSPASSNCLVGLRPTRGLLSRRGMLPSSPTQDMPGIMGRRAEDVVLLLDALAWPDECDEATSGISPWPAPGYFVALKSYSLRGKRLGLLKVNCGNDPDVLRAVNGAAQVMERCGMEVVELEEPFLDCECLLRENNLIRFEQKDSVESYLSGEENGMALRLFSECLNSGLIVEDALRSLQASFRLGRASNDEEYRRRLRNREATREKTLELMESLRLDGLFYPSQRILTVPVGAPGGQAGRNGIIASNLGFPAISFPAGFSAPSKTAPIGLPIGMELLGAPLSEKFLLAAASAFEKTARIRKAPPGFPDVV